MSDLKNTTPAPGNDVSNAHTLAIIAASHRVLLDAMDRVEVHPCDANNDDVRAAGLYGPIRELYDAFKARTSASTRVAHAAQPPDDAVDARPAWWPNTPQKVREFFAGDFHSLSYGIKGDGERIAHEDDHYEILARDYMSAFARALDAAPIKALPAWWPDTPEKVRDFVGGNFVSRTYAGDSAQGKWQPHSEDRYLVIARDIMSQFDRVEWEGR